MGKRSVGRNEPCPCGSGRKYKTCCLDADREVERVGFEGLTLVGGAGGTDARDHVGDDAWQAELVPLPAAIDDDPAARPCAALVVDEEGPLWAELHSRPSGEPEEVAELLAAAVATAVDKTGVGPARVEARHEEVVAALSHRLEPRGIEAVARIRLGVLDRVAAEMVASDDPEAFDFDFGRPCTSAALTWEGWALPEEVVAELFSATAAFYRGRPWEAIDDDDEVEVETEEGRSWALSVLGGGGIERGLTLYSDPGDRERVASAPLHDPGLTDLFEGQAVCLTLEPPDELPDPMRREVLRSGWEVAASDAYPAVFTINAPGGGISRAVARDLTSALRTLANAAPALAEATTIWAAAEWSDPDTGALLRLPPPTRGTARYLGPSPSSAAPPASIHRVRVTLELVEPPVWRLLEVPSDTALHELDDVVQAAMGWDGSHLSSFEIDGVRYAEDEEGWLGFEDPDVAVGEVVPEPGTRFEYVYDFGDHWAHELVIEAVEAPEPGASYPRCTGGERACPPEDCGGPGGYERVLAAIGVSPDADWLDAREAEEVRDWVGDFDPERFDVEEVNQRLEAIVGRPTLDPEAAARFDDLSARLSRVAEAGDLPPDLIDGAVDVLHDYAAAHPEGFLRGRKPEILVAAALHSAGMLFFPWHGWRPTIAELADRFGVSEASISSRSREIRDHVQGRPPVYGALDYGALDYDDLDFGDLGHGALGHGALGGGALGGAMRQLAALLGEAVGLDPFAELSDAVGLPHTPGPFDPQALAEAAGLEADDVQALERALRRGADRERERQGRTEPDPRPLVERLADDDAFGAGLREVVRSDDVTSAGLDALARWVVARIPSAGPPSFEPVPTSSLLALNHLASQGVLSGEALADAVVLVLETAPDPDDGLEAAEVEALVRAVGTAEELDPMERIGILQELVERPDWGRDGRVGPDVVTLLAEDEAIPVDIRYDTLGYISGIFDPKPQSLPSSPAVRRRALVHRIELEDDPETLIGPLLDSGADHEVRGLAAAELLERLADELPASEVEAAVRRGLGAGQAPVRQAFLRTGRALLGDDVRAWAPEEPSSSPGDSDEGSGEIDQLRLL